MTLAERRAVMKKKHGGDIIEEMPFEGKAITFSMKSRFFVLLKLLNV